MPVESKSRNMEFPRKINGHTQNNVSYRQLQVVVPAENLPSFKMQKTQKQQFEAMMEYL